MKTPTYSALAFATLLTTGAAAAAPLTYKGTFSGAAENPPNSSMGMGSAVVTFDMTAHMLNVDVLFANLTGVSTAAHIHCCTTTPLDGSAGIATETPSFGGFPAGVYGGLYSMMFDTSQATSWNPAFIAANGGTTAGAEAAFGAGLASASAYLNIHSTAFPGGEVRAFLQPVPEPGQWGMLLLGVPVVWAARRRRRP